MLDKMRLSFPLLLALLVVGFSKDVSSRRFPRRFRHKVLEGSEQDVPTEPTQTPSDTLPSPDQISRWFRDQYEDWSDSLTQGHLDLRPALRVDWDLNSDLDWWLGDNVCVSEDEKESEAEDGDEVHTHGMLVSTMCESTATANKCVTTLRRGRKVKVITKIRQCCHGYEREEGRPGCTKRIQLRNIVDKMEQLGATQFVEALQGVRLLQNIRRGNITIFAPTNEALEIADLESIVENVMPRGETIIHASRQLELMAGRIRNIIATHVLPEVRRSSQLHDEQLVETLNEDSSVRINFYNVERRRPRLMTVNCVPVNSTDNIATNGVIHVVDGVIMPARETIQEIIARDRHFSTLNELLVSAEMASELRKSGQYTLFAPTNEAFRELMANPRMMQRFDSNKQCLKNLLHSFLVPNVICSAAIPQRKVHTRNALRCGVDLQRLANETIVLNEEASLQILDVMATNGVLHGVDRVSMPVHAMSALEVAEKAGAKQFLQLVRHAGLADRLNSLNEFTLFLPTDEAIQDLPDLVRQRLMSDRQLLKQTLLFHVSPFLLDTADLNSDQRLDTLHGYEKKLIVKTDRSSLLSRLRRPSTIQCASRLAKQQLRSCGAVIHPIDKLMIPPSGDVFDVLEKDGRFGRFVQLLRDANMADQLRDDSNPVTVFAPTDEAFEELSEAKTSWLNSDNADRLQRFLQTHIVNGIVCCASANRFGHRRRTLAGSTITARIGHTSGMVVDGVSTAECDLMAENGVIHAMQQVLPIAMNSMAMRRTNFMSFFNRPLNLDHWWQIPEDIASFFDD